MSKKVLGVSWLNGRFHAAALNGVVVSGSWSAPATVEEVPAFASTLGEAVRQTRFTGTEVKLVLDHRSLLFQVQETPPATGKVVGQMLERQIERSQFFETKAVWGRLNLPQAKGRLRFLLALLPQLFVERLVESCAALGLELSGIFPLPAILEGQLSALGLATEEIVLLGADLGGALHLLLGKGDGTVLFARTVVTGASVGDERAVQEINRTLHFAQQQFGANVTQLFVFGGEAYATLRDLPIGNNLKIQASPVSEELVYYARRAAVLSPRLPLNLIPPSRQRKRQLQKLAALGIAALFCISVAVATASQLTVRARERRAAQVTTAMEAENRKREAARSLQQQAARWRTFVQVVGATNEPPVAELFARYLACNIPNALRLTQVDVTRTAGGWNCRLEGVAREESEGFLAQLEHFEKELQNGLFQLRITDSTHHQLVQGTAALPRPATAETERPFFVSATIP